MPTKRRQPPAAAALPWPADKVERWPTENLIPAANNARTHSEAQIDQIAAAIKEWGMTTAILVDEHGNIIAGHGRVLAAKKLGLETVPVMVAFGWTDEQKRAYTVADNKLGLNSDWDEDLLKAELGDLQDASFDLGLVGFSTEELGDLLAPEPDAVPVERSTARNQQTVIQFNIVFDDEAQQQAWFGFVRMLKQRYPSQSTLGARLGAFLQAQEATA